MLLFLLYILAFTHGNVAIKYNFDTSLWLGYFFVKCPSNTLGEGGGSMDGLGVPFKLLSSGKQQREMKDHIFN